MWSGAAVGWGSLEVRGPMGAQGMSSAQGASGGKGDTGESGIIGWSGGQWGLGRPVGSWANEGSGDTGVRSKLGRGPLEGVRGH